MFIIIYFNQHTLNLLDVQLGIEIANFWQQVLKPRGSYMEVLTVTPQLIEGNGYEAQQTSKEQTKMTGFRLLKRFIIVHNVLFCVNTHA